jgi:tetratricopeptide (TPR) repeat protein
MSELSEIARFRDTGLGGQIDDARSFINMINDSRTAFAKAEQFFADGDYFSAIEQYRLVVPEDKNFDDAQDGLAKAGDEYKKSVLDEAERLANNRNLTGAIRVLDDALAVFGDDDELNRQRDVYVGLDVAAKIDDAFDMADDGNYNGAITSLRTLQSQHPGNNDVSRALSDIETRHIAEIMEEADGYKDANDFEGARRVLNSGLSLHPGNATIQSALTDLRGSEKEDIISQANTLTDSGRHDEAINLLRTSAFSTDADVLRLIDDITAKQPVMLGVDILPSQTDRISLFTSDAPQGMMGALYSHGFRAETSRWNQRSRITFNLDGNYTHLAGLYGPMSDSHDVGTVTLTIFGDGIALRQYAMTITDPLKEFSLDVTGVNELTFEFRNTGGSENDSSYGVANVIASVGTATAQFNAPVGDFFDNAILGRHIHVHHSINTYGGIYDENIYSSTALSNAIFNIDGRYNILSGVYVPNSFTTDGVVTIRIYGDGRLLQTLSVRAADRERAFTMNVENVVQLRFEMSSTLSAWGNASIVMLSNLELS